MALDIGGATYGYDSAGLSTLKNNIRMNCIDASRDQLANGLEGLEAAISAAWVGESADKYTRKLREDVEETRRKLKQVGDQIDALLDAALKGMENVDKSISF